MAWWQNIFGKKSAVLPPPPKRIGRSRADSLYESTDNYSDLEGWLGIDTATPNFHIANNIDKLRSRARHAARNDPLVVGFIKRCERCVVGAEGFRIKPAGEMDESEQQEKVMKSLRRALRLQSKRQNFTFQKNLSRHEFELLCVNQLLRDGEMLIRRRRNTQNDTGYSVEVLDPAALASNFSAGTTGYNNSPPGEKVISGVGVDENYRVTAYYFRQPRSADYSGLYSYHSGEVTRVPADEIMLMFAPMYVNQLRGITPLNTVLRRLEQLKRYQRTVEIAARKNAAMNLSVYKEEGEASKGEWEGEDAPAAAEDAEERDAPNWMSIFGDMVPVLKPGERIDIGPNNFPSENTIPFLTGCKHDVATALGVAATSLTGDYGNINFSAGQLSHKDEEEAFRMIQRMIKDIHDFWFMDWVEWGLQMGVFMDDNGNHIGLNDGNLMLLRDTKWVGKVAIPADPKKQAEAEAIQVQTGVRSRTQIIEENGGDPKQTFAELEAEDAMEFLKEEPPMMGGDGEDGGEDGGEKENEK